MQFVKNTQIYQKQSLVENVYILHVLEENSIF